MRAQIVIFDELDAIAPFEVLRSAAAAGADIQVKMVTLNHTEEITTARGLRIKPEGCLDLADKPDVLIIPGGGWNDRAPIGTRAEVRRGELPAAIARMHGDGVTIATVCTGGMLVAEAGLLRGRPATTHHAALEDLQASRANVIDARVVDDGDIVSAGGVTSGLDLALWLVERYAGPEVALAVESRLEYER